MIAHSEESKGESWHSSGGAAADAAPLAPLSLSVFSRTYLFSSLLRLSFCDFSTSLFTCTILFSYISAFRRHFRDFWIREKNVEHHLRQPRKSQPVCWTPYHHSHNQSCKMHARYLVTSPRMQVVRRVWWWGKVEVEGEGEEGRRGRERDGGREGGGAAAPEVGHAAAALSVVIASASHSHRQPRSSAFPTPTEIGDVCGTRMSKAKQIPFRPSCPRCCLCC